MFLLLLNSDINAGPDVSLDGYCEVFNIYMISGPKTLAAACDDEISVYFDGEKAVEGTSFNTVYTAAIPAATKVIGIACKDRADHYGIVASTDDGVATDDTWVCSSKLVEGWNKPGFQDKNNDFSLPSEGNQYTNG